MSATPFNEVEMMILANLAYSDVPGGLYSKDGTSQSPVTLENMLKDKVIKRNLTEEFGAEAVKSLIKKAESGNYTIVKAVNDRDGTGFAALAIEGPDDGTVTVAARGTESFSLDYDSRRDVYSDLQLGTRIEADQQKKMNEFMSDLDKYDSIYLTGHSLGGNLAVSGAVCFAYPDKIKHVYTYNAPGQNAAYIAAHAAGIISVRDKITNYQNEGDIISDIDTPIGKVIVCKSSGKVSLWTFANHHLKKFDISSGTFQSVNGKSLGHLLVYFASTVLTCSISLYKFITGQYFSEYVTSVLKKLSSWIDKKLHPGKQYSAENPYITVDTYKLEEYSQRLSRINQRIANIDNRMDSLYWRICDIEDLLESAIVLRNLIQADILTSYSSRLRQCSSYLTSTSEMFRQAERNINSKMIYV